MFNKIAAATAALVGMSSTLVGVTALPTNATEVAARSISPAGTHTGQACSPVESSIRARLTILVVGTVDLLRDWTMSMQLVERYAGGNPNNNPVCGRTADITYNGKIIRVGIVDRCEGCALWDVDLSPSAFQQFAPLATGRLYGVTWHFN
ncbi:hypothetical protein FRC10_000504 [Ceratobasidium sp. 414]|nr:hypothetical protein FRC10_000504 [Ceratobasidium sp. 414]